MTEEWMGGAERLELAITGEQVALLSEAQMEFEEAWAQFVASRQRLTEARRRLDDKSAGIIAGHRLRNGRAIAVRSDPPRLVVEVEVRTGGNPAS